MSFFAKPTPPPAVRNKNVRTMAVFYAVLLTILVLAQLFTFDTFLELLREFGLPGGIQMAYFIGAFLVTVEVLALPFLLRMPLSKAFRWVSMVCGWLAAAIWMTLSLWLVLTDAPVSTVGFLGTLIDTMPGWWAVFISAALAILAAWASWGMWPGRRKK